MCKEILQSNITILFTIFIIHVLLCMYVLANTDTDNKTSLRFISGKFEVCVQSLLYWKNLHSNKLRTCARITVRRQVSIQSTGWC
jgi:hypothetical protein